VQNSIQGLGANLLTISPGSQQTSGGVQGGFGSSQTLTLDDATAIADAHFASINQVFTGSFQARSSYSRQK